MRPLHVLVNVSTPSLRLAGAFGNVGILSDAASLSESIRRVLAPPGDRAVRAMFSQARFGRCVAKLAILKGRTMCGCLVAELEKSDGSIRDSTRAPVGAKWQYPAECENSSREAGCGRR